MTESGSRDTAVETVPVSVVALSRALAGHRRTPFGDVGVTSTQMDALFLITHSDAPLTPSGLAAKLGVTRGAVTQPVEGLRELDLVEQVPHPSDARSRLLTLTPGAAGAEHRFEAQLVASFRPVFHSLSTDELQTLATLLTRLETHP